MDGPSCPVGGRLAIFVAGMAAVLLSAGLRFDGGDFVTLLAVMAGAKPLEIRNRRDSMVTYFWLISWSSPACLFLKIFP